MPLNIVGDGIINLMEGLVDEKYAYPYVQLAFNVGGGISYSKLTTEEI